MNIPTGTPLVYELDSDLKPICYYYLTREIETLEGVWYKYTLPMYCIFISEVIYSVILYGCK